MKGSVNANYSNFDNLFYALYFFFGALNVS